MNLNAIFKSTVFYVFLLFVFTFIDSGIIHAKSGMKMVVITADFAGIELLDSEFAPETARLAENGAAGLMVTKTLQTGSTTAAHTTLGAGLRSDYVRGARLSFNLNETYLERNAADIYFTRTGQPPDGEIVNISIGNLRKDNKSTEWGSRPGALGSLLGENGYKTAVIGNSDYDSLVSRNAVLIAMDQMGCVDGGNVSSEIISTDGKFPWGILTDPKKVSEEFQKYYPEFDFIVIEYADVLRADKFAAISMADIRDELYKNALQRLDMLVANIYGLIDPATTQLIILVPTPSSQDVIDKKKLTPIIMNGAGIGNGVLFTNSTKRNGFVLNTDFAPHVLYFFNIENPPDFIGAPIASEPQDKPLDFLKKLAERDTFVEQKNWLLRNVIIWHLIVLTICFVGALRVDVLSKGWINTLTIIVIFTASLFLSFLLIANFPSANTPFLFPLVQFLICAIFSIFTWLFRGAQNRILFLSFAYFFLISVDQLTGGSLIKNSVLGYYPQIGARFYGIGNEFMGFMVSAPILLVGTILDLNRKHENTIKWIAVPVLLFSIFVVGSPSVGSNFGGLIACSTSALFMLIYLFRGKVNFVTVISVILSVAVFVTAVAAIDTFILGGQTHVGKLTERVISGGGAEEIVKVATRKLAVNLKLLRVSFWSALFIISVAIGGMAHYLPIERLKRLFKRSKGFQQAYVSSLCGAYAAFAFNDSGIVPGATALILPTACLFLLMFSREKENPIENY